MGSSKVGFRVVSASSQEESHKALELNVHSPNTIGWRSHRFCLYPQELVLQLERRVRLRKIQVLSHHYLISSRIDLFIGDVPRGSTQIMSNNNATEFKRLGHIELSDNERTGQHARELKSVHVDAVGQYIRLVLHKNHFHTLNIYNQVSLIAVNVIGENIFTDQSVCPVDLLLSKAFPADILYPTNTRHDRISAVDDVAFDLYQDKEVAQMIRTLEKMKVEAVKAERFEEAKQLKITIEALHAGGRKLAQLDVEKRIAIEQEDYDLAEVKKTELNSRREELYNQLNIRELLAETKNTNSVKKWQQQNRSTPPTSPPYSSPRLPPPPFSLLPVVSPRIEESRAVSPLTTRLTTPPARLQPINTSVTTADQKFIPYDDRILPALAHQRQLVAGGGAGEDQGGGRGEEQPEWTSPRRSNFESVQQQQQQQEREENEADHDNNNDGEMGTMTAKDQKEAALAVDIYGMQLVLKAYNKTWSLREDATLAVHNQLHSLPPPPGTDRETAVVNLRAAAIIVNRAVKDSVSGVFSAGLALLKMILTEYVVKHNILKSETGGFMDQVLPTLITKTGDKSVRQRDAAKAFILEASQFPKIAPLHVVTRECLIPFKSSTPTRLAISRMELVDQLYQTHGLSQSGGGGGALTVDNLMSFTVPALDNSSGDVRQHAEDLIISVYKDAGEQVRDFLPPDTANQRKNIIYRKLFEAFDDIDIRPGGRAETKEREAENRRRLEAEHLQTDLKSLRESKPSVNVNTAEIEKVCVFCGERNDNFTEDGLDRHYYKHCPMLTKCESCKQVIEIPDLTKHLLAECDRKSDYSKCPRCTEAITKTIFKNHLAQKLCTVADVKKRRCPLCHANFSAPFSVGSGDNDIWKYHLMGRGLEGCKKNPRKAAVGANTYRPMGGAVNRPVVGQNVVLRG